MPKSRPSTHGCGQRHEEVDATYVMSTCHPACKLDGPAAAAVGSSLMITTLFYQSSNGKQGRQQSAQKSTAATGASKPAEHQERSLSCQHPVGCVRYTRACSWANYNQVTAPLLRYGMIEGLWGRGGRVNREQGRLRPRRVLPAYAAGTAGVAPMEARCSTAGG